MDFDTIAPPEDLKADLASLETTVGGDASGDKSRRLVSYLKQAETQALEMGLRSMDFEEKTFAGLLGEAFGASRRIVMAAWAKKHGGDLVV